jgi:hypothetical protein
MTVTSAAISKRIMSEVILEFWGAKNLSRPETFLALSDVCLPWHRQHLNFSSNMSHIQIPECFHSIEPEHPRSRSRHTAGRFGNVVKQQNGSRNVISCRSRWKPTSRSTT